MVSVQVLVRVRTTYYCNLPWHNKEAALSLTEGETGLWETSSISRSVNMACRSSWEILEDVDLLVATSLYSGGSEWDLDGSDLMSPLVPDWATWYTMPSSAARSAILFASLRLRLDYVGENNSRNFLWSNSPHPASNPFFVGRLRFFGIFNLVFSSYQLMGTIVL